MTKRIIIVAVAALLVGLSTYASVEIYFDIMYPLKYQKQVSKYSDKYDLDKAFVNSVINAESRFRADIVSRAGAVGLMQLMPYTAQWLADENGIEYSPDRLSDPDVNIELGTCYLRYLIDKFDDVDIALAAYNAGEGNVAGWLGDTRYSRNGKLVDIPYRETGTYVARIKKNNQIYSSNVSKVRLMSRLS